MTIAENPVSGEDAPAPTIIIIPPRKWVPVDFRELIQYHELLYFFPGGM